MVSFVFFDNQTWFSCKFVFFCKTYLAANRKLSGTALCIEDWILAEIVYFVGGRSRRVVVDGQFNRKFHFQRAQPISICFLKEKVIFMYVRTDWSLSLVITPLIGSKSKLTGI